MLLGEDMGKNESLLTLLTPLVKMAVGVISYTI